MSISTLIMELRNQYRQEQAPTERSSMSGQRLVYPELTARVALVDRTCSPNIALSDPEYYWVARQNEALFGVWLSNILPPTQ